MQTKNNTETWYQKGNWKTWWKTSPRPSKSKSIHYWISWSTIYQKDLPSIIYLKYLSHPSSNYQRTSRNLVFSSYRSRNTAQLHPPNLIGFFWQIQCFPSSKSLSALWIGVGCVWVQIFSQGITMEEERRRDNKDFSLKNE